jgi:arylsulfatase
MTRIPEGSAPDLKNRSWQIEAQVKVPDGGAEGLIMTQGGRFNGLGLYLKEGKPIFMYNFLDLERSSVIAPEALSPGEHTILVRFKYSGGGAGQPADIELLVDGSNAAHGRIKKTIPIRLSLDETLDIGEDTGTPVSEDYKVPFKFTGEIEKVTISLE